MKRVPRQTALSSRHFARQSTSPLLGEHEQQEAPAHGHGQILTTRVGLRFPSGITFEQWAEAGPKLSSLVDSFAWCLGDWLVYGQDRYEGRYAKTVERIGLDYQTLRNYAWVARKFESSRRRENLSFQHHAEVASLPPAEQDAWLDRAEGGGWSRNQLRRHVQEARGRGTSSQPTSSALPRVQVEKARLECWRLAAERASIDLTSWIVTALDEAAERALGAGTTGDGAAPPGQVAGSPLLRL
ncbi:LmbU family transcriptional regulator [Plantactinospora sp. WMMC1484]|uniref:LmbU family transcriptional regulator n=1 Tax=Plantactinospora sp. WMMC1484 TaxID=3404122 RepID=UPI003BF55B10